MDVEKFRLSEALELQLCGNDFSHDDQGIPNTRCEFDRSKFIRLSVESFPDLQGSQSAFRKVCSISQNQPEIKLEERFLIMNAANQCIWGVFCHENSESETIANTPTSDSIIESNNLLCFPYWSHPKDGTNMRVHFPSRMLQEAFAERKALRAKLQEWMDGGEDCKIGMHQCGPQSTSNMTDWKMQDVDVDVDVKFIDWIAELQGISRVTWRGGTFARKQNAYDKEFEVAKKVSSHPNIVCSIGQLQDQETPAYFMEYISHDLCSFIVERVRVRIDSNKPPFSPHEALGILWQIAKAMKHMHQQGVVHCDLKPDNILISEISISDNSKHYMVKVADFGSAQDLASFGPGGFIPGGTTDSYAAPEALTKRVTKRETKREKKSPPIDNPKGIDVFSFGIVAFEVLTGDTNYMHKHFQGGLEIIRESRRKVIENTLRPPLREMRDKNKEIIQDEELISLIESCWDHEPPKRPSFEKICKDLNEAKVRISAHDSDRRRKRSVMSSCFNSCWACLAP